MIDPSDIEQAALRDCLKTFGDAASAIGFDKPLGYYTEAEALLIISAIVTRYTEALVERQDAAVVPPTYTVEALQTEHPWRSAR